MRIVVAGRFTLRNNHVIITAEFNDYQFEITFLLDSQITRPYVGRSVKHNVLRNVFRIRKNRYETFG